MQNEPACSRILAIGANPALVRHYRATHLDYMTAHRWDVDVRDRFLGETTGAPAEARRHAAAACWAITRSDTVAEFPDWQRLRAMGLAL